MNSVISTDGPPNAQNGPSTVLGVSFFMTGISMIDALPKTTAAGTWTFEFFPEHIGCSIVAVGDLGANTIAINHWHNDTETETDAYDSNEVALVLSATNPSIPIYAACSLKVTKGVTANAVGVSVAGIKA